MALRTPTLRTTARLHPATVQDYAVPRRRWSATSRPRRTDPLAALAPAVRREVARLCAERGVPPERVRIISPTEAVIP